MQGPALYAYNDAVFTSEDWKGILLLSDSVKEKDPMKVGRFGLGFKSVFHMTGMVDNSCIGSLALVSRCCLPKITRTHLNCQSYMQNTVGLCFRTCCRKVTVNA